MHSGVFATDSAVSGCVATQLARRERPPALPESRPTLAAHAMRRWWTATVSRENANPSTIALEIDISALSVEREPPLCRLLVSIGLATAPAEKARAMMLDKANDIFQWIIQKHTDFVRKFFSETYLMRQCGQTALRGHACVATFTEKCPHILPGKRFGKRRGTIDVYQGVVRAGFQKPHAYTLGGRSLSSRRAYFSQISDIQWGKRLPHLSPASMDAQCATTYSTKGFDIQTLLTGNLYRSLWRHGNGRRDTCPVRIFTTARELSGTDDS